jgi:hypothetical protein
LCASRCKSNNMDSAGIALIVRIPYIRQIAVSADFLFETIDLAIWAVLEPSLGIIAGCLASIRPLFKGLGVGLNRNKQYSSRAKYDSKSHWYSSSRNMKKLDNRSADSEQQPDPNGSQMELRQQSEIGSAKEHHSNRTQSSSWGVEGSRHGDAGSRAQDVINVQTSIYIATTRMSDVTERSSEDTALTRDLALHGGVGLPAAPPPSRVR